MSYNFNKIKKICKAFADEFGDTLEGQGYHAIYAMINSEKESQIGDVRTLVNEIKAMTDSLGLKELISFEIRVWDKEIAIKDYFLGQQIEVKSAEAFLTRMRAIAESKEGQEYIKKEHEKLIANNIKL